MLFFGNDETNMENEKSMRPVDSNRIQFLQMNFSPRFRAQHRRSIDGRLCSAAFVHDHQTYTNCTDVTDPSGTAGSDWCYVEPQLLNQAGGKANWG
jgi:hypothetical protein